MTDNPISEHDIAHLVPAFYARVRQDPLLGPIFDGAIDDWSVMLSSGRYEGQPMVAHIRHEESLTAGAFDRWLDLWRQTTDDLLEPAAAAALQEKADRIAESLQLGVRFYRERAAA
jgi:hemoglobin